MMVPFGRLYILGAVAFAESITIPVPLCDEHIAARKEREHRVAVWLAAAFALGLAMVGVALYMNCRTSGGDLTDLSMVAGGLVVAASMFGMLKARALFPIRLRSKPWRKTGAGRRTAFVFEFPDDASACRFHEENAAPGLGERGDLDRLGIEADLAGPDQASLLRTLVVYLVGFLISGLLLLVAYAFKWGWL